jgi:hypothetical protein
MKVSANAVPLIGINNTFPKIEEKLFCQETLTKNAKTHHSLGQETLTKQLLQPHWETDN